MRHDTRIDTDHGAAWLPTESAVAQPISHTPTGVRADADDQWQWLGEQRAARVPAATDSPRRIPGRRAVWIALTVALTFAAAVTGAGIRAVTGVPETAAVIPTLHATPPTTTAVSDACTGLTGATITDGPGDIRSMPGVIAAFEHAYYRRRDAEAALRLVAPEAGLGADSLAAGIASIPTGTTHCVAITPIADTAAEVHLVERHPDGSRVDYLQLINTHPTPNGNVLITNFQKRG